MGFEFLMVDEDGAPFFPEDVDASIPTGCVEPRFQGGGSIRLVPELEKCVLDGILRSLDVSEKCTGIRDEFALIRFQACCKVVGFHGCRCGDGRGNSRWLASLLE